MFPVSDTNESGHFPIFTVLLILLNIWVFFQELITPNLDQLIVHYALIPALVSTSNPHTWLPFITSQFLHGGWLHIIGNMLFLWVFGDNVERRLGILFIPFFLAAGVAGGLAQYIVDPTSTIPSLGASGAIAGVLGAYLYFYPHNLIRTLIFIFVFVTFIEIPAWVMIVYWFVIQVFNSFTSIAQTSQASGGVAYFAHIGGFVFGWVVAHLWGKRQLEPSI